MEKEIMKEAQQSVESLVFDNVRNILHLGSDVTGAFVGNLPDFSKCRDLISDFNVNAKFIGQMPKFEDDHLQSF